MDKGWGMKVCSGGKGLVLSQVLQLPWTSQTPSHSGIYLIYLSSALWCSSAEFPQRSTAV